MGICIQSQNKIQMIGNWKQKDEHKQYLKYRNHSEHLIALSVFIGCYGVPWSFH